MSETSELVPGENEFTGMTVEKIEAQAERCLISAFGKDRFSQESIELEKVLTACGPLRAEIQQRAMARAIAAVRDQLRHMLQSSIFLPKRGPRQSTSGRTPITGLGEILSSLVESALGGGGTDQYHLAVEFYGRQDHKSLGKVRVCVGNVRKKLLTYYGEGPGRADPIKIIVATGTYIPSFSCRFGPNVDGDKPARVDLTMLTGNLGTEVFAAFSPDGREIVFSWNGEDEHFYSLYVKRAESNQVHRLTEARGDDLSPAWSPDGRSVAFLRVNPGHAEILTIPSAGGTEHHLVDVYPIRWEILGRQLAWHPKGKALAIVDRPSPQKPFCISLHSLVDGSWQVLTSPPPGTVGDSDPAFSANGAQLAFIRTTNVGVKDIYVRASPLAAPRRVTADDAYLSGLTWSGDSAEIVFSSTRNGFPCLWRTYVHRGQPTLISGLRGDALYPSVGGRRLVYTQLSMRTNICRIGLGEGEDHVTLIQSARHDVSPQISPDGKTIAFASDRDGAFEIWVCNADGSAPRRVTTFHSPTGPGSPRWSPDGSRLVFDCRSEGRSDLYIVSLESGELQQITFGPGENAVPSWSKTNWIYFSSNRTGEWQVWRIRPQGKLLAQVTAHGGFAPFESPAGDFVYYKKGRTEAGVCRIPANGGCEESVLNAPPRGLWGYWAVGKNGVYFLDCGQENVGLLSVLRSVALKRFNWSDGSITFLRQLDGLRTTPYAGIAVSPDDAWMLLTRSERSNGNIILKEYFD